MSAPQGAESLPTHPRPGETVKTHLEAVIAGEFGCKTALHLFSGPKQRRDGVAAYLEARGWHCVDIDTVNDDGGDLLNDALWELIFTAVISGNVAFVWMGPPCSTFSSARQHGAGPQPVRDAEHPRGFPKAWLSVAQIEEVRAANYMTLQCVRLGELAMAKDVGFAIENPRPWPGRGCASMFEFEEFVELIRRPGVRCVDFHQCMHGAETAKPTRVVFCGVELDSLAAKCNHPARDWWCEYKDNNGRWVGEWQHASHPRLVRSRTADGKWASAAAAAYPGPLNERIADAVCRSGCRGPGPVYAPPPAA